MGCALGSPLPPTLPNVFLCFHKQNALTNSNSYATEDMLMIYLFYFVDVTILGNLKIV